MLRFSLAAAAAILSTSAFAHASITPNTAAGGATVKVAIAVPHGCDGAPTDKVTVIIPEGFVSTKPQVKAGWQIEVTQGDVGDTPALRNQHAAAAKLNAARSLLEGDPFVQALQRDFAATIVPHSIKPL